MHHTGRSHAPYNRQYHGLDGPHPAKFGFQSAAARDLPEQRVRVYFFEDRHAARCETNQHHGVFHLIYTQIFSSSYERYSEVFPNLGHAVPISGHSFQESYFAECTRGAAERQLARPR